MAEGGVFSCVLISFVTVLCFGLVADFGTGMWKAIEMRKQVKDHLESWNLRLKQTNYCAVIWQSWNTDQCKHMNTCEIVKFNVRKVAKIVYSNKTRKWCGKEEKVACNPKGCGHNKTKTKSNEVLRVKDLKWSEWSKCVAGKRSRYRMSNKNTKVKMEFDSKEIDKWNRLIEKKKC